MILLLDNFDSFVFNLAQAFGALGAEPHVVRSDALDVAAIRRLRPAALVVSPGPGHPDDAGVSVAAIHALAHELPILGVCLGHQAIGVAFGGRVTRGREPVHGRTSTVRHDGQGLFAGIPSPFEACRYHSLVVDGDLPEALVPTAWTDDGVIMAIAHRDRPVFGVQFHPESFRTPLGPRLLANFLSVAAAVPVRP